MEAKIEKMQEMFTKDLEELKSKQTEMDNTLEGINCRITEAEEWINDLKDRMVEITATEHNAGKKKKKNEKKLQSKRPLGQHSTHQHLHHRGPRRRREKERT